MKKMLIPSIVVFLSVLFAGANFLVASDNSKNMLSDPFGSSPKGASPNCGPEERYKFDVAINSNEDFIAFLRNNKINPNVELTNFKENQSGETNWDKIAGAVKVENVGRRTVYILDYNPHPGECAGFTLKMTNDGYVSVYGCCGK
jgi:hypothetical protein